MNMLIDELPTTVLIDGVNYPIATDYRISVMFETMVFDSELSDKKKLLTALNLYFGNNIPNDVEKAVDKIMWFYRCGKEEKAQRRPSKFLIGNQMFQPEQKRIYDYDYDDAYIYSAFLQQYGVDLQDEMLHWWKFKAMFRSLRDDTEFVKIMSYRSIKITSNMTKSQRDFYTEMKRLHALPAPKNEIDKMKMLENILLNGGDIAGIHTGGG